MKKCVLLFFVSLVVNLFLCAGFAAAQDAGKGVVTGRVTDPDNRPLQGARIELQSRGQVAVTDNQGQFTLTNADLGNFTLNVSYIGFETFTQPVTIVSGNNAPLNISLKVSTVNAVVEVRAERQRGEVEALNRQLTADNIVQVLPANVIRSLPNTNIADAVGRLPSVSLERDEGEGKYVQIRGTEPRLSNVTINGVHVSSPEGNVRQVKLDVIPSDLVESIEVSKTLSANQDGDAIGGSINLVTRTAGNEPFYSMSAIYGYTHILNGRSLTQFSATAGRRFGADKKLGILFGGSYDFNGRGINDIEPAPGTNDAGIPLTFGTDIREYKYYRHRYGFAGSADYRLKNGSSAFVRGLFSDFKDYGDTWVYSPTPNFVTTTATDNGGNIDYRHYIRRPDQQIFSVTAGENLNIRQYALNYQFAVSRSRQNGGVFPTTYFHGPDNVNFGFDNSNPLAPRFPVLNNVNIYDPTAYTLYRTVSGDSRAKELDLEGSVSLIRSYTLGSRFGSFEVGGKFRNGNKKQNVNQMTYNAVGTPFTLAQVLGNTTDPNYYFKLYNLGPLSDYDKITNLVNSNPKSFSLDPIQTRLRSDPNNYNTTERVYAAYAMNTITFGKARLQTGVRVETTQSKFTGNRVNRDAAGTYVTTPVPGKNNYTNVLPSVQFIYAFTPKTNIRAAYGIGIARPNFSDLPPFLTQSDRRNTVSAGNPLLKPTRSNNFDLLFERYLKPYGVIQFGAFYKDLKNPIYSTQTVLTSGQFAGFTQTQPTNGAKAHIAGTEASYQQQLLFLPGALSGLGFSTNYSYTNSRAIVANRAVNPALIRQAPNNYNFDFTYDKSRLSARVGITHNDAYIYQYNYTDGADGGLTGPNGDVYLYAHTQVDAQASIRLQRRLQLVVSGLNLGNEVFGFYQGSPRYPIQREFYNRTFSVGIRWGSSSDK